MDGPPEPQGGPSPEKLEQLRLLLYGRDALDPLLVISEASRAMQARLDAYHAHLDRAAQKLARRERAR